MKQYLKIILKFICLISAIFFFTLACIGTKEWFVEMFIQKDGKSWLDWYLYLPMMFFSISYTFYLGFIILSIMIKHKIIKHSMNIMLGISLFSLFFYFVCSFSHYSHPIHLLTNFLAPILIALFILTFNIFWNKKIL